MRVVAGAFCLLLWAATGCANNAYTLQGKVVSLQQESATLAQRDVESGDEIIVPHAHDTESRVRIIRMVVGIPLAALTVLLLVRR